MRRENRDSLLTQGSTLAIASFMVLFLELALIRWLPGEVRVTAYFPNLVLIGAFLGLGVGALQTGRPSLFWMWPASMLVTVGVALAMGRIAFTAEGLNEHLWLLYDDLPKDAPVFFSVRTPIVVMFALTTAVFIPMGQLVGDRLRQFKNADRPLEGYCVDLAGSLLGVLVFAGASWTGVPPAAWFGLVTLLAVALAWPGRLMMGAVASVGIVLTTAVAGADSGDVYSPYYAISVDSIEGLPDVRIRANGALHQIAIDVERAGAGGTSARARAVEGYHAPYQRLRRDVGRALVLGAGTGNDVAVLLDRGATEVHAVEIDPVLVDLGRRIHPNHPYQSERVSVFVTDARSYLDQSDERYDLIVFGTLDSMTRLAALSSVRLDTFMYTQEALRAAREHLAPGGGMVLYFQVGEPYINERLIGLVASAFGELPTLIRGNFSLFNTVLLAGPAFETLAESAPDLDKWYMDTRLPTLTLPSDDWPYLYLQRRSIGPFYTSLMLILAALALVATFLATRSGIGREGVSHPDVEMALYGAGFLLMEARFVTAMNLLWGATWITSAVVFGAILLTVLLATLLMSRWIIRWDVAMALLFASLALAYLLPPHALLRFSGFSRGIASVLYVGGPVVFAAICFAARFEQRSDASRAFGWNLLGAVFGGLLEFSGMAFGFSFLLLLVVACYAGAFLLGRRDVIKPRVVMATPARE